MSIVMFHFHHFLSVLFYAFFGETCYFFICFNSINFCLLQYFYESCFRIFVRQFQHLIVISVVICCLSFLIQVVVFLVLSMTECPLYPQNLAYYIRRLCLILRSSILVGTLLRFSMQILGCSCELWF